MKSKKSSDLRDSVASLCRDPSSGSMRKFNMKHKHETGTSSHESLRDSKGQYICSGCSKSIRKDKFLLKACDRFWHESCLKCDKCHGKLGELGSTLYCKSNMHLCRQDYLSLYGSTGICSVCDKMIHAYEMVMRAKKNVYHLECFACQLCNLRFCVGERFYLCENKIVCQYDYEEHILPLEKSIVNRSDSEQVISISGFSDQIGPTKLHIDDHGLVNMDESNEEARSEEPSSSGRRQEKRDKDIMTSIDPDREPLEADTNPTDELDK